MALPSNDDIAQLGSDDNDSGFDEANDFIFVGASTSFYEVEIKHNREYNQNGAYLWPIDEEGMDFMDLQHDAFVGASLGRLHFAPIKSPPKRVLDVGTGTGIWAIQFADENPEAEIICTEISALQPPYLPTNVWIEEANAEDDWDFSDGDFDFIHERLLISGSIKDPQKFFHQAFRHTKSGGYLEIQETKVQIQSDHYVFPDDSPMKHWCNELERAVSMMHCSVNLDFDVLAQQMRTAGFIDVRIKIINIPIGKWAATPQQRHAGKCQLTALLAYIEDISLVPFLDILEQGRAEMEVLLASARQELCKEKAYFYWPAAAIYGRKP